ncbi:MAG: shikimate kinase [Cyanobacteriota/Melainabacteria group bacterium]
MISRLLEKNWKRLTQWTWLEQSISTGGGLPVAEGTMTMLKAHKTVVYLSADAATLANVAEGQDKTASGWQASSVDNKEDFNKTNKEKFEGCSYYEKEILYKMTDITKTLSFQTPSQ